jgi:hypothetical protein
MMGFAPSLLLMEIGCGIGKGKVVRKIKHLKEKDLLHLSHHSHRCLII